MKIEEVRANVFMDVSIGRVSLGRIVVELYHDLAPKASANFLALSKTYTKSDGTQLSYKRTSFHRVIKNFMIQAGNISSPSSTSSGESIYGGTFGDENCTEVSEPFLLCMANSGPNTNSSQFFITTFPSPHLNGKHTVFGHVVHGKSIIREIERADVDKNFLPKIQIVVEECGEWKESMGSPVYNACYDNIGGDIYEEWPEDDMHINKESSESVFKAAEIIKESGTLLFKKGDKRNAFFKYRKAVNYVLEYVPDEDQEPEWFKKYVDLKTKIYLNLSLTCLQLKDFQKCHNYCTFLIEMENVEKSQLGKAYYRRGVASIEMKKYDKSFADLTMAKSLVGGDAAIDREITRCGTLIEEKKAQDKSKYSKFFG